MSKRLSEIPFEWEFFHDEIRDINWWGCFLPFGCVTIEERDKGVFHLCEYVNCYTLYNHWFNMDFDTLCDAKECFENWFRKDVNDCK